MTQSKLTTIIDRIERKYKNRRADARNIVIDCPWCGEHSYKFHLAIETRIPRDKRAPSFKCWKCNKHGNIYRLLKFIGITLEFDDVEYLYDEAPSLFDELIDVAEEDTTAVELPEDCIKLTKDNTSYACKGAIEYTLNRGLTLDDIERYNLHFCVSGRYANRIIIPSYTQGGALTFYSGRSIFANVERKSLNPDKELIGTGKSDILHNIQHNVAKDTVIINEGQFDVMTTDGVGLFGKVLSEAQLRLLIGLDAKQFIIMLDGDALQAAYKIAERLHPYRKVLICKLPADKDPNAIGKDGLIPYIANAEVYTPANSLMFDLVDGGIPK